MEWVI